MTKLRVALVEDDRYLVNELRRCFDASGRLKVVHTAATAEDGIHWLSAHPHGWDLVLIDIFLAKGHGYAVLKHCRKSHRRQRVVMMSNYGRQEAREQALRQGADQFFDKSTQLDEMLAYCMAPVRPPRGAARPGSAP